MGWRRHVAIVVGAVALSGTAWVVTDLAWEDRGPQYVVERGTRVSDAWGRSRLDADRTGADRTGPSCTPPPGLRDGTYTCVVTRPPALRPVPYREYADRRSP